jgi:hypothetical protein
MHRDQSTVRILKVQSLTRGSAMDCRRLVSPASGGLEEVVPDLIRFGVPRTHNDSPVLSPHFDEGPVALATPPRSTSSSASEIHSVTPAGVTNSTLQSAS